MAEWLTNPTGDLALDVIESWALDFHYHRDQMNANLHASVKVKYSEVTMDLALALAAGGRSKYSMHQVMHAVVDRARRDVTYWVEYRDVMDAWLVAQYGPGASV